MKLPRPRYRAVFALVPLVLTVFGITALAAGQTGNAGTGKDDLKGEASPFPGMVEVPAGRFKMGVNRKELEKRLIPPGRGRQHPLLVGPQKDVFWGILMLETPEHNAETEAYSIGRYELTNAQYLLFLDRACMTSVFTTDKMNTIYLVAKQIYGENPSEWQQLTIYWLNLKRLEGLKTEIFEANKELIKRLIAEHNADLPKAAPKIKEFKELPEKKRLGAWLLFKLPPNTALTAYNRTVPRHWPKAQPSKDELNHPVRFVSGEDANAFCEWAGMHVPTEKEWEKAARGPKDLLFPWADTWDCSNKIEKNLLLWLGSDAAPRGPAPATRDRPIASNSLPAGQSGYGCFHMLGNVMEWTSSVPVRHPRSEADWPHWGRADFRVLRGLGYGNGKPYKDKELFIRNTARILESQDGPISLTNRYGILGFRTAKYPTPARDVLIHRVEALGKDSEGLDPARGLGVEKTDYAAPGEEGEGLVYVLGGTRIVGVIPMEKLSFAITKDVLKASKEALQEGKDPVLLGYLYWNADLEVEALEIRHPEKVRTAPEPGEGEEPADGEKGEGEGEKPDEKPAEKPDEKPAEKPDEKPDEKLAEKPDEKPDETAEGEVEAAPAGPTEHKVRYPAPKRGFLLGLADERLALYEMKILGPVLKAYVPVLTDSEGKPLADAVLAKVKPKEFQSEATIDPATGIVHLRFTLATRSKTSKEVFGVDLYLKVSGGISGTWTQVQPAK